MNTNYRVNLKDDIVTISKPVSSTVVIRVPYNKINSLDNLNNFIVYILFGHNSSGKDKVYVGKSKNGVDYRPKAHEDKYDNWEFCYILTQHKEQTFFNDGVIQYIESKISNNINDLQRYDNTTIVTSTGTINEFEKDDCESYIEEVCNMLYAIGLDITHKNNCLNSEVKETESSDGEVETYYLERHKRSLNLTVKATMQIINGKYVVKAGSIVSPVIVQDLEINTKLKRSKSTIIDNILQHDVVMNTPSGASNFVVGCLTNGWTEWKDSEGRTLDSLKRKHNI